MKAEYDTDWRKARELKSRGLRLALVGTRGELAGLNIPTHNSSGIAAPLLFQTRLSPRATACKITEGLRSLSRRTRKREGNPPWRASSNESSITRQIERT